MTPLTTPSLPRSVLCLALMAVCVVGCAHAPSTPVDRAALRAAPDEALDLLAAWIALAGTDARADLRALKAPDFRYREIDGDAERRVDRTRRLRVCGDPEMWVADGGYDVEMWVHALGTDGVVRSGHRRLSIRAVDGALKVASDTFDVSGQRELSTPWPNGVTCRPRRRGCLVILDDELGPRGPTRRLSWPRRARFSAE